MQLTGSRSEETAQLEEIIKMAMGSGIFRQTVMHTIINFFGDGLSQAQWTQTRQSKCSKTPKTKYPSKKVMCRWYEGMKDSLLQPKTRAKRG